jgi:cytoskeletal protein CcmA (bactofilin family)
MTNELAQFKPERASGSECFVSAEAVWEGRISTTGDLRIEGTVHGEVETQGSLSVATRAQIDGSVTARRIVLGGEMSGKIRCDERLELLTGSSLGGDIETGTLVVHEGAYIEANRFKMLRSELPESGR